MIQNATKQLSPEYPFAPGNTTGGATTITGTGGTGTDNTNPRKRTGSIDEGKGGSAQGSPEKFARGAGKGDKNKGRTVNYFEDDTTNRMDDVGDGNWEARLAHQSIQ